MEFDRRRNVSTSFSRWEFRMPDLMTDQVITHCIGHRSSLLAFRRNPNFLLFMISRNTSDSKKVNLTRFAPDAAHATMLGAGLIGR